MSEDTGGAARLRGVVKDYGRGAAAVQALRGIDLDIEPGSFTVVRGRSGSGKSTLLNLLGCIDTASAGTVRILGEDTAALDDAQRTRLRATRIGFVFQSFSLVPVLSALENVEYPLQLCEPDARMRRERARAALAAVGLADQAQRRPGELSGGQRQRVAVARALVKQPALVLADEPTANLDSGTGAALIALMRRMQRDSGTTFVLSSHDPQLIADADRCVDLADGCLQHAAGGRA
ncbi:MAG: ABC transporter ATP-binding protein [Piscinibacter sp.]|uniref:ABC transporter ATP-binding protein n=1 Tax=Piscinibacter TaxID=1114981 RepID=UPI000FDD4063|nr:MULTISPECIES: ABC transporter ATP-binding protein [Piscinibacter]MCW5667480.1 ABC transporter ATP-binding protein [Piscinibacter sp.]